MERVSGAENEELCDWINSLPSVIPTWRNVIDKNTSGSYEKIPHLYPYVCNEGGVGINIQPSNEENSRNVVQLESSRCQDEYCALSRILPLTTSKSGKVAVDDPCMSDVYNQQRKNRKYKYFLKIWQSRVKGKVNGSDLRDSLSVLDKKIRSQRSIRNVYVPREAKMSVRLIDKNTDKIIPDFNRKFIKGCLKFHDEISLVLHAGGKSLNKVIATRLTRDDNGSVSFQRSIKQRKLSLPKETIYQISSSCCDNDMKYHGTARQDKAVTYFQFESSDDNCFSVSSKYCVFRKKSIQCAEVNPYYSGEFVVMNANGLCKIRNVEAEKWSFAEKKNLQIENRRGSVEYGSHPMEIVCCFDDGIYYKDIRSKSTTVTALSSSCLSVTKNSSYMFTKQFANKELEQLVATTNQILILDKRVPNMPIFSCNHMLLLPPMSCSISALNDNGKYIVAISDQVHQDTCCLSLAGQDDLTLQPLMTSPIWHASKPSDLLHSVLLNYPSDFRNVENRLKMPLIGSCVIPRANNGFQILTLTSLGDLFHQGYSNNSKQDEKTFNYSMGFDKSEMILPVAEREVIEEWLKIFKNNPTRRCRGKEDQKIVFKKKNASETFKSMISMEKSDSDSCNESLLEESFDLGRMKTSEEIGAIPYAKLDLNRYNDYFSSKLLNMYFKDNGNVSPIKMSSSQDSSTDLDQSLNDIFTESSIDDRRCHRTSYINDLNETNAVEASNSRSIVNSNSVAKVMPTLKRRRLNFNVGGF